MKIAFVLSLALSISVMFPLTSRSQDAFDSTAATGTESNYTGSQTQQGEGDIFDPELPQLQGATNGTIEPQEITDAWLSSKEIKLRNLLIKPIVCEEPTPPGLFPPLPQYPSLPTLVLAEVAMRKDSKNEQLAKRHYGLGIQCAKKEKFKLAGEEFSIALSYSSDEMQICKSMRDDLETIAEKFESSNKLEEQANCLRLALFFNHLDQTLETSLDNCLKANGADPSDMTLRHSIEEQLEELGDLRLASIELRAICKREHTLTNQLKLCEMLADSGSDREALYLLQRLLKGDWHDRNKLTEARCHLALAQLFSKYSRTYNDRGAHASSISIFENALIESRIAVILNPRNKEAQKLFIELSKKAVELASDEASNHFLLAAAYLISGDSSKANSQYAICRALEPSDERLAQAKVVMEIISRDGSSLLNGKIGNSISKVQDMLDADPENAQLWKFLGRLFDQSADSERAQACYKRANNIFYGIYEPVVAR